MNNYSLLNLKDNPFKNGTPTISRNKKDIVWAGLPELKTKIETIYSNALNYSSRQVVLNWGPYGGGKTFTANYFINNPPTEDHAKFTQIYVRSPKNGNNATEELFKSIFDYLKFRNVRAQIKLVLENCGEDNLFDFINDRIQSEEFTSAILLLATEDEEITQIMNRYVYSGVTKAELKKAGLSRDLKSSVDRIKFLAGILLCYIGAEIKPENSKPVVLWLDEMEGLIYYTQKNYTSFSQVLRDLIDILNEHFVLFMNFTLAEPEEGTIEFLLGAALWSRITRKIRFKELDLNDGLRYVKDLLKNAYDSESGIILFDDQTITTILNSIPGELTPREINKYFNEILNITLESGTPTINQGIIDQAILRLQED